MMPLLIGLTGKKGSGKNTVGEFIKEWAEKEGYQAELRGFADSLKLSFARIFVPDATLEEALLFADQMKNYGELKFNAPLPPDIFDRFGPQSVISGRQALQTYGTEAHRQVFGDNFWVDQLLPDNDSNGGPNSSVWDDSTDIRIITDARFPNEAKRVLALKGIMIRVNRPGMDANDAHASEQDLDDKYISLNLFNRADLDDLRTTVELVMEHAIPDITGIKVDTFA